MGHFKDLRAIRFVSRISLWSGKDIFLLVFLTFFYWFKYFFASKNVWILRLICPRLLHFPLLMSILNGVIFAFHYLEWESQFAFYWDNNWWLSWHCRSRNILFHVCFEGIWNVCWIIPDLKKYLFHWGFSVTRCWAFHLCHILTIMIFCYACGFSFQIFWVLKRDTWTFGISYSFAFEIFNTLSKNVIEMQSVLSLKISFHIYNVIVFMQTFSSFSSSIVSLTLIIV